MVSLAVLVLLSSAHVSAVRSGTANQRAAAWLRRHPDSDPDAAGMNDLKNSDPNAFAIVQALLTKRSLGLLDPNAPSAAFGGASHPKQRSFKQEADEAGVTAQATVSDSNVAVPYPSAGRGSSVALPFPDVAPEQNGAHFGFHPNNDDAMVQSVLGAANQLVTHGSAFTTKKSTTKLADPSSPISLDWGNPHAGLDQPAAPTRQSLVVSQSRSSGQSDQSSMAMASQLSADGSAIGEELVIQDENAHNSVSSANHHAPIVAPSLDWDSHAGVEAQASQMSMGQQNSYLAATPLTAAQPEYQPQDPVQSMEGSSFHKLAESFRKFSHASSLGATQATVTQTVDYNKDLGSNYKQDLQAAKNNQWKFALESTEWGKNSAPFKAISQVQEALDDSDGQDPAEEEHVRQQKIAKFLGAPKQYAHYAPKAAMTQESEEDGNDGGAKFEEWIGSKKARQLEKSYDDVMPKNEYLNNYMADLTH